MSSLIKCGVCGANYVVGSKDYYRCASVKDRDTCGNSASVRIAQIEDVALSTLQTELLTDEHAKLFAAEFDREIEREALRRGPIQRSPAEADVHAHPALRERFEAPITRLRESLSDQENRTEAAKVLAEQMKEIVIYPPASGSEWRRRSPPARSG